MTIQMPLSVSMRLQREHYQLRDCMDQVIAAKERWDKEPQNPKKVGEYCDAIVRLKKAESRLNQFKIAIAGCYLNLN